VRIRENIFVSLLRFTTLLAYKRFSIKEEKKKEKKDDVSDDVLRTRTGHA